jgi:hypothetical protein
MEAPARNFYVLRCLLLLFGTSAAPGARCVLRVPLGLLVSKARKPLGSYSFHLGAFRDRLCVLAIRPVGTAKELTFVVPVRSYNQFDGPTSGVFALGAVDFYLGSIFQLHNAPDYVRIHCLGKIM